MNRLSGIVLSSLLALTASASEAAVVRQLLEKFEEKILLDARGTLIMTNSVGRIEIVGGPGQGLVLQAVRTTRGVDDAAVAEAKSLNPIVVAGDARNRILKSAGPAESPGRWSTVIDYVLRVPSSAQIRIFSNHSERLSVSNVTGTVFIKNTSGAIELRGPLGATNVDTINGNVTAVFAKRPSNDTVLRTVNGRIDLRVPADSSFGWVAETLHGDILTNVRTQGRFDPRNSGTLFRGSVNGPGGPTIETATMTGQVLLSVHGKAPESAQSLLAGMSQFSVAPPRQQILLHRTVRLDSVKGDYVFETTLGSISVREVLGNARVSTRAGEITLGRVFGRAQVTSLGGPLSFGDVSGEIKARTSGGDVTVRAARKGGDISTVGGNVLVLFASGPLTLGSGGGDIIVRQTSGPVRARTESGDISINLDPGVKSQRIEAETLGGNVAINLPARFGANVDATIITDAGSTDAIRCDFPGLSISREPFGSKVRIRAVGKLGGGGQRMELRAADGSIAIVSQYVPQLVVGPPK